MLQSLLKLAGRQLNGHKAYRRNHGCALAKRERQQLRLDHGQGLCCVLLVEVQPEVGCLIRTATKHLQCVVKASASRHADLTYTGNEDLVNAQACKVVKCLRQCCSRAVSLLGSEEDPPKAFGVLVAESTRELDSSLDVSLLCAHDCQPGGRRSPGRSLPGQIGISAG